MGNNFSSQSVVFRLTAMWALSESALGGILHAFRIPFTGLIVGGFAVLFISLIAIYADNKKSILSSMIVVLLIKFSISPHTPITAYIAVTLQGVLGYLIFSFISSYKIAAFALAVITQLLSAFQRLITITLIFGNAFWEAIDEFADSIHKKFFTVASNEIEFSVSLLLIGIYGLIHFCGGLVFGYLVIKIPAKINASLINTKFQDINSIEIMQTARKKKKWYRKKMSRMFIILLLAASILTYVFPVTEETFFISIIYMLLRASVIIIIWLTIISPLLLKLITKVFEKKRSEYGNYFDNVLQLLPLLKKIVIYSWRESKKYPGITRVKEFIIQTFSLSLFLDTKEN